MVSLALVLVMAAPPDAGLIAAARGAVQPRVHAPQDVDPALVGRVCVVDDTIIERERAHAGPFAPVGLPVGSHGRRERGDEGIILARRQPEVSCAEVVLDGPGLPFLPGGRPME